MSHSIHTSSRSSTGRTVKCPCCSSWCPMPSLKTLVCGGCNATIIYQKDDRSVKCYPCKHVTHPQETNDGDSSFYQFVPLQINRVGPPQGNWVICQEVNRVPPQTNRVVPSQNLVNPSIVNRVVPQTNPLIPHQVNRIVHPQINRVIPPQVNLVNLSIVNRFVPHNNRAVPSQINRVIPPQINQRKRKANAETESTATSPFTPNPESESTSAFVADYVARLVRDCAPGMRANRGEVKEDKTEPKHKKTSPGSLID
ncbi:unnamed protein product [Eruca vesicaria subsp. sativa]|uniref:Uncharacterized protein n=1 Tax=Eruca vesicaria subsp. sativa TaxID=29727 RepID=A0ABC8KLV9_ERUVS|nr:unnamed protein product [Eruca vesicaria subsp. sativa]